VRAGFPAAEITLIGLPWAASFADRFAAYVDRFLPFPGYPGIDEIAVDPARTETFLREQRACNYDLVIQMHGSGMTSNPFALALGRSVTAGFSPCRPEPQRRTSPVLTDDRSDAKRSFAAALDDRRLWRATVDESDTTAPPTCAAGSRAARTRG